MLREKNSYSVADLLSKHAPCSGTLSQLVVEDLEKVLEAQVFEGDTFWNFDPSPRQFALGDAFEVNRIKFEEKAVIGSIPRITIAIRAPM
jgi:hypothetical protein